MFDVLIVGAGPSGLCAAKTILECDGARINLRLVDTNKTVGGVWAQENLYPGLRTNNLRGGIDFTDLPMHDGFGVPAGSHIPGEAMHEYFKQYAQKWDILRRIDFETFVSEISRLEGPEGWNVKVRKGNVVHDLQTKKLIIATGITHTPHRPSIAGAKYFEAPIIHSAELGQRSGIITKDPQIKTVAVLGGAKSAYDAVYLSALAGKQVEWIVRKSGKGPCWVFPALATPLKAHREKIPLRRFISCFSPWLWRDGMGWLRSFLHSTSFGKKIAQAFWSKMHAETLHECGYAEDKALSTLEPEQSPFWYGTCTGVYSYSPDLFDFIRSGQVRVHREDIEALAPHNVLLANGTNLPADALITATGFSAKPTFEFSPPSLHSDLGVPTTSYSQTQRDFWNHLNHTAELTIVSKFPRLLIGPFKGPASTVVQPYNPGVDPELEYTPYRLYRAIAPPGLATQGDRSLAFVGMMGNIANTIRLELQCLWAYAYINDKLDIKAGTVFDETALMSRYCRYRSPFGHGRFYPDLTFDQVPYFDLLVQDLGLNYWRKSNIFSELFAPYEQKDYRGIVQEWLRKRERIEGREIKTHSRVTSRGLELEEMKRGLLTTSRAHSRASSIESTRRLD